MQCIKCFYTSVVRARNTFWFPRIPCEGDYCFVFYWAWGHAGVPSKDLNTKEADTDGTPSVWSGFSNQHLCVPLLNHIFLLARCVDKHEEVMRCQIDSTDIAAFLPAHPERRSYYDTSPHWSHLTHRYVLQDEQVITYAHCNYAYCVAYFNQMSFLW